MRETFGVRLSSYQREKLKERASECGITEAELVRILIDRVIERKINLTNSIEGVDLRGLVRQAERRHVGVQTLIDAIVEQLDESGRKKRKRD